MAVNAHLLEQVRQMSEFFEFNNRQYLPSNGHHLVS
jgi:hypothetical protein